MSQCAPPPPPPLLDLPTSWGMRHISEQTLTSCLLARKICRHVQREGRRKEESSTNDKETKCERQEREASGTLSITLRQVTTAMTINTSGRTNIKWRLGRKKQTNSIRKITYFGQNWIIAVLEKGTQIELTECWKRKERKYWNAQLKDGSKPGRRMEDSQL